ncbi:hypothetical protein Misp03_37440 [Microbispora sp. NBRC 16548]|nr:hypothetical protein Misp03_37440 [Microbispora sp. NBRC 16548]
MPKSLSVRVRSATVTVRRSLDHFSSRVFSANGASRQEVRPGPAVPQGAAPARCRTAWDGRAAGHTPRGRTSGPRRRPWPRFKIIPSPSLDAPSFALLSGSFHRI